jgi:hypothetical protein
MSALAMEIAIKRRLRHYGLGQPTPIALPFLPSTEGPQILSGIAVSASIDLMRTKFGPFSVTWPQGVKLNYRHREVAGKILELSYTSDGEVKIECEATHSLARRSPSFSVGATIKRWEIIDDGPQFYALVNEAVIDEVSLTASPCNPNCVVKGRAPVMTAPGEFFDLMAQKVALITRLVEARQCPH